MKRIVITGIGALTPLGNNITATWQNILAGKTNVKPIDHFDTQGFSTTFAAMLENPPVDDYFSIKEIKKVDPFIQYGVIAADQAFSDAKLVVTEENANRIGVAVGSSIGGLETLEQNKTTLIEKGPRRVSPFFVPATIMNMVAGHISMRLNLQGPNYSVATACSSGAHSIITAAQQIQLGLVDIMLAGGAEKGSTPLSLAGFGNAKALSSRNDSPETASRPWDRDRDGFVIGDGAGVVVLESLEHAKARGAHIYAELSGYGMTADAYHITSPHEQGRGASAAMQAALVSAKLNPEAIQYINAHGTSTPLGDMVEVKAVKHVFGDHAYQLKMSSTKSMTGHLLGAAGAVEIILSIMALQDQVAPPTINLDNPDEYCDLDFVAKQAQSLKINHLLSNSFGFGGTNSSVLLSRFYG